MDLAGSEKVGKTGASGQTLEEAKTINKSLTTLSLVISKLTDDKSSHINYRDSKLTRVLQESLGGNSKTLLIINCSPAFDNLEETTSTLLFGQRAKKIQNKATVNQEKTKEDYRRENQHLLEQLYELKRENRQLREKLSGSHLDYEGGLLSDAGFDSFGVQ